MNAPTAPSSSNRGELIFFGALIAGIGLLVFVVSHATSAEDDANYVVFDSPGVAISVRVDGKAAGNENELSINKVEGGERHPVIVELAPGKHAVEVLDAKQQVLETATIEAPPKQLHAVYSVGESRRYVLATVAYATTLDTAPLIELSALTSQLSLLPAQGDARIRKRDLSTVNRVFPASVTTKQRDTLLRSLCTVTDDGVPECDVP